MIPRAVIVRGEMEATQVDLAIKVIGRLQDKKVRIGDRIRRGDQLLTLISPDLEAKLVQATAASNIAEVEMQKLLIGTRAEDIQGQLKAWMRATIDGEVAQINIDRGELASPGAALITIVDLTDIWVTANP